MVRRTKNVAMHNKMRYIAAIPKQDGPNETAPATLRAASTKGQENGQDGRENR
jgi:hypothetical protein